MRGDLINPHSDFHPMPHLGLIVCNFQTFAISFKYRISTFVILYLSRHRLTGIKLDIDPEDHIYIQFDVSYWLQDGTKDEKFILSNFAREFGEFKFKVIVGISPLQFGNECIPGIGWH